MSWTSKTCMSKSQKYWLVLLTVKHPGLDPAPTVPYNSLLLME